ncbi:MAG: WD40 repeat domain-containing protein, partial [Promethearchaeia archaeon]
MAWAPEDLVLASGADDGLVCLWDMTRLLVPPGDSSTEFARISSAGLGLGDGDGVGAHAREGRGAGKECQGALDVVMLEGHQAPVLALCFTSSGRVVVAADFSGAVLLWSRASYSVLFRLSGLTGPVSSVCMADGDATILTGCSDGSLRA